MVIDLLHAAQELADLGESGALCTRLDSSGDGALVGADGKVRVGVAPPREIVDAAAEVIATGSARVVEVSGADWFVEPVSPPPRLVVLGAISVADALVPMAAAAGFQVFVVDQRAWLARAERYPDAAQVICGPPTQGLDEIGIDAGTSVVSLLHEPRLEDEVLTTALRSACRYVGAMGSTKSTKAKRERLQAAGLTSADLERLHAPIGIDVGARRPQEIAVSILAELVAVARGRR